MSALTLVAIGAVATPASASVTVDVTNNTVCSPLAAGDGVTNDRAAIQCAIDYVSAHGGGVVELPGAKNYLSGGLVLKSNVNLQIDLNATLTQSQSTADYVAPVPGVGHDVPCSTNCPPWNYYFYRNQPFIYAGNPTTAGTTNVAITGLGTINMTFNGSASATIEEDAIGFSHVDGFTVSGIHVTHGNAVYMALYNSEHGLVSGITLDNLGVNLANTGGIELMNSQHVRITESTMNVADDGIALYESYGDPRGDGASYWSSTTNTQSLTDVRIDHNNITDTCCKAIAVIPWGTSNPNQSNARMSAVTITNNTLTASGAAAVGCWCDDPWHGQSPFTGDEIDPSPMSDWTLSANTYTGATSLNTAGISDLSCDWSGCPTRISATVDDTDSAFAYSGAWSTYNNASDYGGNHQTANSAGASVTISFTGTEGKLLGEKGYNTGIAHVYLDGVDEGIVDLYEPTYAYQSLIWDTGVIASGSHTLKLAWTGTKNASSSGTYIDVDAVAYATGSANVDDTDSAFAYSGAWSSYNNASDYEGSHHTANSAGASVTISFTGTEGVLLGEKGDNTGIAHVYLDGVDKGTVDLYSPAYTFQSPIYDTGVISSGSHTLRLDWTGTKNASSSNYYVDVDAVTVTP